MLATLGVQFQPPPEQKQETNDGYPSGKEYPERDLALAELFEVGAEESLVRVESPLVIL